MNGRRIALIALAMAAGLCFWFTSEGRTARKATRAIPADSSRAPVTATSSAALDGSRPRSAVVPAAPTTVEVHKTSLIEDVRFDPERPCRGDDVIVTVALRSSASDAKVFVDGYPGSPRVIQAKDAGRQQVRVLARSWGDQYDRTDATLPVDDCRNETGPRSVIRAHMVSPHVYHLSLDDSGDAHEGENDVVQWTFGDGKSDVGNPVVHRYAPRVDRSQSSYLVVARVESGRGPQVTRTAVTHAEPLAVAARTEFPVLSNDGERFVDWDAKKGLRTTRQIENPLNETVTFEHAELRGFPCDGSEVQTRNLPTERISGPIVVPPGESMEIPLDVSAEVFSKPICQLLVRLGGDAQGRVATTAFALETGLPESRFPVDPSMHEAIRAIGHRRGLGVPITAEDIELYRLSHAAKAGSRAPPRSYD